MSVQDPRVCDPRPDCPAGYEILQEPFQNKGISFTEAERKALGLEGLLPPGFNTMEEQIARTMENFRKKPSDMEKYIFMMTLLERDRTLFDRIVLDNLEEMMPIIYTPTVGRACQVYSHIFQRPQGLFLSERFKGRFAEILNNWPEQDVRIIVITDGERILGLGDLGVSGMGIPVGKICLYVACAGIHPSHCLPVTLDTGTNNVSLLNDPLYLGMRHQRIRGEAYDELIEELVTALRSRYNDPLIHFEDFGNVNAFRLLSRYRDQACVFNDDIQGTASVALAGLYAAMRMTNNRLTDQKILFLGAGGAGIGIGELIVSAMMNEGLSEAEARQRCWFVDSKGLITRQRDHLTEHKQTFAHEHDDVPDFPSAVSALKPTAIIGVSGQAGKFTPQVLSTMAGCNERPIIFALSNPTTKSECTAEEAYTWTEGRAIFASGSPFDAVTVGGKTFAPGQANNSFIFPALGLGVVAARARHITDEMFQVAAKVLAEEATEDDFSRGNLFPPLNRIRNVSVRIATAVAGVAYRQGLARSPEPDDLDTFIRSQMYAPKYERFL